MQLPHGYRYGFTLIELMVVVGILALVSGIMIPSFSNYTRNQSLKEAQENFKSDLRSIQNMALTGMGSDRTDSAGRYARYWGVSYASGAFSYSVYLLTAANCNDLSYRIESQTLNLPSNITFNTGSSGCLLFSLEDGSVYTTGGGPINTVNISLRHNASSTTKTITVNRPGLIYSSN
ncbi:MAG: hypothetical protein KatS3mg101_0417 [Patescibacteria group bacterium]|nr:MAG: hypothetical protein KatS3mg101_0417 [Patescibacteria group bacterium]